MAANRLLPAKVTEQTLANLAMECLSLYSWLNSGFLFFFKRKRILLKLLGSDFDLPDTVDAGLRTASSGKLYVRSGLSPNLWRVAFHMRLKELSAQLKGSDPGSAVCRGRPAVRTVQTRNYVLSRGNCRNRRGFLVTKTDTPFRSTVSGH